MGNSKINGLGGNAPQVNLNVVEANQPVQQPNVPLEGPGQHDPGVDAAKLSQGEQLVKQLDVLLLRAAKGSAWRLPDPLWSCITAGSGRKAFRGKTPGTRMVILFSAGFSEEMRLFVTMPSLHAPELFCQFLCHIHAHLHIFRCITCHQFFIR